jgi:glycosyltransferase involved in cell wall biosynthesis
VNSPPRPVAPAPDPHVLIVVENESYPSDRRVRQEARALVESGYRATVVSPTSGRDPEFEEVIDGVRVLRFRVPPQGRGAIGYVREYAYALFRIRRLLRKLRHESFTAVIACNPPDFLIHLARPFRRRGAGLIFDLHDPSPELFEANFHRRGLIYRVLVALERWAQRTADVVMTVNQPCADLVRARGGVDRERVFVLVTCPDSRSFFPVAADPDLRQGKQHLVLWVGRMSRKENLPLLLEAADEIVNKRGRDDIGFAIVGDGDVRPELEAEAERRGLNGCVNFPGEFGDELLRRWMATADVCVSLDQRNSMNDRSLMVKVMEYMAMGRPIVQFPLAEMKRVCGEASVYAEDGDAGDLAEKICALIDDPGRGQRLGEAARQQLLQAGLTWPEQVPILVAAVERACTLRGARVAGDANGHPTGQIVAQSEWTQERTPAL